MSERRITGYDPQTGAPIYESAQPQGGRIMGYDPKTGAPIYENAQPHSGRIVGYDPQTGAPVYENVQSQSGRITGYDPKTGAPIYENAQPYSGRIVGYDPQAGTPIYEGQENGGGQGFRSGYGQAENYGYAGPGGFPGNTQPPKKAKKAKKGLIIGGIAAAVVLVMVIAGIFLAGLFSKPGTKILTAAKNTFVQDEATAKFKEAGEIASDNKYGINLEVKEGEESVRVQYAQDGSGQSLEGVLSYSGQEYRLHEYLDDQALYLDCSLFSDTLSYPYTQESYSGDLKKAAQLLQLAGGFDLDTVDDSLKLLYSLVTAKPKSGSSSAMEILDAFNALEYEKLDAKSIDLGEKEISCSGYSFTIDADFLNARMKEMRGEEEEENARKLQELLQTFARLTGNDYLEMAASAANGNFDDFPELKCKVYLNKKKLAMIEIETEIEEEPVKSSIVFRGSDIPWHDMKIIVDAEGQEIAANFRAEMSGTEEHMQLALEHGGTAELNYDIENGDISLTADGSEIFKGTLKIDKKSMEYTMNLEELTSEKGQLSFAVTDSYEVKSISGGQNLKEMTWNDMLKFVEGTALYDYLQSYLMYIGAAGTLFD